MYRNFSGASRHDHPLSKHISCLMHIGAYLVGSHIEDSLVLICFYKRKIRFVAELPEALQSETPEKSLFIGIIIYTQCFIFFKEIVLKIIASEKRGIFMLRPCTRKFKFRRHFTVCSENRKTVFPGHGNHNGDSSHSAAILEQYSIPIALRVIYYSALRRASAGKTHIIFQHISSRKFSFKRIRREAGFGSHPSVSQ